MKKILSILFAFTLNFSIAQGNNLQFNRAFVYNSENNPGTPSPTYIPARVAEFSSITVPAGKVWKIQSVTMYERIQNQTHSGQVGHASDVFKSIIPKSLINSSLQLNDIPIFIGGHYSNSAIDYPIWIPSGTYRPHSWEQNGSFLEFSIYIIEFNIVQ